MRPAGGLTCVLAGGQALEGLLFGVEAADAATLTVVALVIIGVAVVSGLWPARRAASSDPLIALRNE